MRCTYHDNPSNRESIRSVLLSGLVLLTALFAAAPASAQSEDDLFLFTTSVAPNVLIQLDNSLSMNHIVWHPAFDPNTKYDCEDFDPERTYYISSSGSEKHCGRTRKVHHDSSSVGSTWYDGRYLNWYFSSANTYMTDINNSKNGTRACASVGSPTYAKYQRNRMSAAQQVVLDTICKVEITKSVRFGLSVFREPIDDDGVDPNGGYVEVPINDNTPAHASDLEASVANTKAHSWTPLGETLFQNYTYFMSRDPDDLIDGVTAGTTFPLYQYDTQPAGGGGAFQSTLSKVIPSPVEYSCQKNFIIVITDGEPTRDDFDRDPTATAVGFSEYGDLIGDYHADGQVEVPEDDDWEPAYYIDDIAKFMHENDFRPDMDGDQTLDIYTIGFTTSPEANSLLRRTADLGNGLFFTSNNAEELTEAISKAITDIIEKSQSFTAATVPSTRTADGGDFFTSFFLPSAKIAFWQGHLRAFDIDAAGDIYDKNGTCAYLDPDPGECNSGPFNPAAVPFWDAGEQVPASGSRSLHVSVPNGATNKLANFDSALTAALMGIEPFAAPPAPAPNQIFPGSRALNEEGLADEVTSYLRGCVFSTGVSGANVMADVACSDRQWRLGDVFHSAPAVVVGPTGAIPESSYALFRDTYETRDRVIYAGANDGFLHAFATGSYNAVTRRYSKGTGREIFGFMPWEIRSEVHNLITDSPAGRHYYVDGSPQVADVWVHPSSTATAKTAAQWKTVLVGGLRQGGRSYFGLDITNPSSASYPGYMWEWPLENDPDDPNVKTSHLWYLGQGWSKPIITRVRLRVGLNDNDGAGYERWVAVVTGGFDPSGDPNDKTNYDVNRSEGRAIVILDLKTGEPLAVKRYDASASDAQADMEFAIPSTPSVFDLNGDGFADVIYVGDLGGQLFKWSINNIGEDRVNDASPAGTYTQPNWPFKKFFQAPVTSISGDKFYKSFYYPPSGTRIGKTIYLAMGSGERSDLGFEGFASKDENNRFYVMTDPDPYEVNPVPFPTLVESDLTNVTGDATCSSVGDRGYYFKVSDGEKFVTNSEIFAGIVFVGSFIPTNTGDPCTSKGDGALYAFRVECGEAYYESGGGVPIRRVDLDEGLPTDPQISVGVNGKDNRIYIEKSGADLESIGAPDINLGNGAMLYWREVQ